MASDSGAEFNDRCKNAPVKPTFANSLRSETEECETADTTCDRLVLKLSLGRAEKGERH
jgi:hypothetical protein